MATFLTRKSGWTQAKVRRKGFPQVSKTFETRREAEAWARQVESEMDRGIFADRSEAERTTLADAIDRYEREVTPTKRGAAVEAYRLNTWRTSDLGQRSLAALRSSDFAKWRDERMSKKGGGVSAATVVRELNLISHVFTIARKEWGLEVLRNPVETVRRPTVANARNRLFRPGEEERLLTVTDKARSADLGPIVRLALETAMRRGEILALAWEHIDLEGKVAHLPSTKNGSSRDVPLSSAAVEVLKGHGGKDRPKRGPVFEATEHTVKLAFPRAVERARKAYIKECAKAGSEADPRMLADLHFHDLRHIATTRIAKRVPNVVELAAITGHRELRMLQRYYHPDVRELAQLLG